MSDYPPSTRSRHPTGDVTFLFAELCGEPDSSSRRNSRPLADVTQVIQIHRGYVFHSGQTAVHAAFAGGSAAFSAAVQAIRTSNAAGQAVLRLALHSGESEERDGAYRGIVPHRLRALLHTAQPGQAVLTQATCDRLSDALPEGVSLHDLGERRVMDLLAPLRLYQIDLVNVPCEFPPLKTLEQYPNNLPIQAFPLIGREKEVEQSSSALEHSRLVTLTGIGGVGKTLLALQLAADLTPDFPDGVWFVDLAPLSSLHSVSGTVARVLGVRERAEKPDLASLAEYLRHKSTLLVLDHCDNVVEECAELTEKLLVACPDLRVLATSRQALGIFAEVTCRVPSLAPAETRDLLTPKALGQCPSVRFFVERAQAAAPTFQLDRDNFGSVADICKRLDGIPLALALAAARISSLSANQLSTKLAEFFSPLQAGSHTSLARQQIVQATLDWTFNRLSDRDRKVLLRLAIFVASWTTEAAAEICGEDISELPATKREGAEKWIGKHSVPDLIEQLASANLVARTGDSRRYSMPETIREYALQKLETAALPALADRHLGYYGRLGSKAELLLCGPEQTAALLRMDADYPNIRAALDWAVTLCPDQDRACDRITAGLDLAWSLKRYWRLRALSCEARNYLTRLVSHPDALNNQGSYARAVGLLSYFSSQAGSGAVALQSVHQSIETLRALGDKPSLAQLLAYLSSVNLVGNSIGSRSFAEEGVDLARQVGDGWSLAMSLGNLGTALRNQGDYEGSRQALTESIQLFEKAGDLLGIVQSVRTLWPVLYQTGDVDSASQLVATWVRRLNKDRDCPHLCWMLLELGCISYLQGEMESAQEQLSESARMFKSRNERLGLASACRVLGYLAARRSNLDSAFEYLSHALKLYADTGELLGTVESVAGLAGCFASRGNSTHAAKLFGSVEAHLEKLGLTRGFIDQMDLIEQMEFDRYVGSMRAQMDDDLAKAWEEGRHLKTEEATALALDLNTAWPAD